MRSSRSASSTRFASRLRRCAPSRQETKVWRSLRSASTSAATARSFRAGGATERGARNTERCASPEDSLLLGEQLHQQTVAPLFAADGALVAAHHADRLEARFFVGADRGCIFRSGVDCDPVMPSIVDQVAYEASHRLGA